MAKGKRKKRVNGAAVDAQTARPKPDKPPKDNRTERLALKVTKDEKARMVERAREAGMGLSAYLRHLLDLSRPSYPARPIHAITLSDGTRYAPPAPRVGDRYRHEIGSVFAVSTVAADGAVRMVGPDGAVVEQSLSDLRSHWTQLDLGAQ